MCPGRHPPPNPDFEVLTLEECAKANLPPDQHERVLQQRERRDRQHRARIEHEVQLRKRTPFGNVC